MSNVFMRKPYLLWGSVFIFSFLISLVLFLLLPPSHDRYVLFFPDAGSGILNGEIRYLPQRPDREEKMAVFLNALILGPADVRHLRVFPREAGLRSILYRGGTAYVDLSSEILFEEREVPLNTAGIAQAVLKNMKFNFPYLTDLVMTVNGRLPGQPYYERPVVRKTPKK